MHPTYGSFISCISFFTGHKLKFEPPSEKASPTTRERSFYPSSSSEQKGARKSGAFSHQQAQARTQRGDLSQAYTLVGHRSAVLPRRTGLT